jgi:hypothetical protein
VCGEIKILKQKVSKRHGKNPWTNLRKPDRHGKTYTLNRWKFTVKESKEDLT